MKTFTEQSNIGEAKYVVNYHDGVSKYDDGSNFHDIRIFKNLKNKNTFIKQLKVEGFESNN